MFVAGSSQRLRLMTAASKHRKRRLKITKKIQWQLEIALYRPLAIWKEASPRETDAAELAAVGDACERWIAHPHINGPGQVTPDTRPPNTESVS
jgi:hypothetical protein